MTYRIWEDLEKVYDSNDEEYVESDFAETHWRVNGPLRSAFLDVLWDDNRVWLTSHATNIFLLLLFDRTTLEVTVELGYGPGECDLHFIQLPYDKREGLELSLTYWLAGLR